MVERILKIYSSGLIFALLVLQTKPDMFGEVSNPSKPLWLLGEFWHKSLLFFEQHTKAFSFGNKMLGYNLNSFLTLYLLLPTFFCLWTSIWLNTYQIGEQNSLLNFDGLMVWCFDGLSVKLSNLFNLLLLSNDQTKYQTIKINIKLSINTNDRPSNRSIQTIDQAIDRTKELKNLNFLRSFACFACFACFA